jgi:predicted RNase H-like HicB family nuclease
MSLCGPALVRILNVIYFERGGIMKNYLFTAVIWREGRRFVSKCPELGVASYGNSLEAAGRALREAVALYLSNARKLGLMKDLSPMLHSAQRFTSSFDIAA